MKTPKTTPAQPVDLPRLVRRLGIGLRLVVIEWVDSHYRSGWTTEPAESLPLKCLSVGWLVEDGKSAKVLSAHVTSEDRPQRFSAAPLLGVSSLSVSDADGIVVKGAVTSSSVEFKGDTCCWHMGYKELVLRYINP